MSTLARIGFAGGVYPDIHLERLEIRKCDIEILVIKDRPEKPYFLQRNYDKAGVRLNPGTIYSRIRDSNTPSDQVAPSHDIEQMWRERFDLDQTPFQRVRNYLQDRTYWTETSEFTWHHSQFPEFTISRRKTIHGQCKEERTGFARHLPPRRLFSRFAFAFTRPQ